MSSVVRFLCFVVFLGSTSLKAQDPNIVFILVDDVGWNGTSVQMDLSVPNSISDYHLTPNIKSIADNGAIMSKAYCAAPVCSPTRNAILTGKAPARNGFTDNEVSTDFTKSLLEPTTRTQIDPADVIIPEQIKLYNSNYLTANFGKWDIDGGGPIANGFDESSGNTSTPHGNNGDQVNDPKRIFSIRDDAIAFITRAKTENKPFYLQLSQNAAHTSFHALTSTLNHWNTNTTPGTLHSNPLYAAMLNDLDDSIGDILTHLNNNGYNNTNTYIVFMADHGALDADANNDPLREGKPSLYEGGIRVPMFVSGPGIIPGSRYSSNISALDLFPTFMEWISNTATNVPSNIDGGSLVSLLENTSSVVTGRNDEVIVHYPHYSAMQTVMISGDYKLLVNYKAGVGGSFELYNLSNDIGESVNLKDINPTELNDLKCKLRDYLVSVGALFPSLNQAHSDYSGLGGTAIDVDNDDLEDLWEFENLLLTRYDGTNNNDGDVFTNLDEFSGSGDPLCVDEVTLSINNLSFNETIKIYPNPTKDLLKIDSKYDLSSSLINVYNMLGAKVYESNFKEKIDLSILNSGVYFLSIEENRQRLLHKKVIVK